MNENYRFTVQVFTEEKYNSMFLWGFFGRFRYDTTDALTKSIWCPLSKWWSACLHFVRRADCKGPNEWWNFVTFQRSQFRYSKKILKKENHQYCSLVHQKSLSKVKADEILFEITKVFVMLNFLLSTVPNKLRV